MPLLRVGHSGISFSPKTTTLGKGGGVPLSKAVLTAAYFNDAEWTTTDKIRWAPSTLVNPLEPGKVRNVRRPGTGILPIVPLSSYTIAVDPKQDYLLTGGEHVVAGTRTGNMQISRGRRVRIQGLDFGGRRLSVLSQQEEVWIEGCRSDGTLTPEGDALFIGGANPAVLTDVPGKAYIAMCHFRGLHGTNDGHDNGTSIVTITMTENGADVVLSTAPLGGTPSPGAKVIIGGTSIGGTLSPPLEGFNDTWTVDVVTSATQFSVRDKYASWAPSAGEIGTGGTLWVQSGAGEHSDGWQVDSTKDLAFLGIDRITVSSSYQCGITARGTALHNSRSNYKVQLIGSDGNPLDPMDPNTVLVFAPQGADYGYPSREFFEVYGTTRFNRPIASFGVYPDTNINTTTGLPNGGVSGTWDEKDVAYWPYFYPQYRGIFINYPVADFCDWDDVGPGYVSPGYSEHVPGAGSVTDIQITLDNAAGVPENLTANASIGWVDVTHTTSADIIDVWISGDEGNHFSMSGRNLVRGRTAFDYESAPTVNLTLTATIRSTGASFTKTFIIPLIDDLAPVTTPTLSYLAQAVTSTNQSTPYSFSALPLGDEAEDRVILVGISVQTSGTARTINSATLTPNLGNAASGVRVARVANGTLMCMDIWRFTVPTGTSATVSFTVSGSCSNAAVVMWRATGLSDIAYDTTSFTGAATGVSPATVTISRPDDGVVLAYGRYGPSGGGAYHSAASDTYATSANLAPVEFAISGATVTWTGVTERVEAQIESSGGSATTMIAVSFGGKG